MAETAVERAYAHVRSAIMAGEISSGTMLSENELATGLAMSRTPVRAALARLQDEGWIVIYPQRGALVRELSAGEVRESAEVRHALETAGVHRATRAQRDRAVAELMSNLDDQAAALADDDLAGFARLALRFHRGFAVLSGNTTLIAVYDKLQARQYLSIVQSGDRIAGDPAGVLAAHRRLLETAATGDWVRFAALLDEHQVESHGLEGVAVGG